MIEWLDDGIVLAARPHGEASAILTLLTHQHGRHAGLVRGARSANARGLYQAGNMVRAEWRARLSEHLGSYRCEPLRAVAAKAMGSSFSLAGLSAVCAITATALPEREPHPAVFEATAALLEALGNEDWGSLYVRWELGLLTQLGFGLDLSKCAATGRNDQLAYVSPKTGRAVSLSAGRPYRDVLLPLPPFLLANDGPPSAHEVGQGMALTGFFLEKAVYGPHEKALPPARGRLAAKIAKA